jgi:hypothetical protein
MFPNAKPSEIVSVLATYDPVSQAAATVTTGWVDAGNLHSVLAILQTGVLGASATLDAKLQQATTSGGAGAKDVTGKAITQIVKASGDNKQALINCRTSELDVEGGFRYVRLSLTVGTAASIVSAVLLGFNVRYEDSSVFNQAGVVQNV